MKAPSYGETKACEQADKLKFARVNFATVVGKQLGKLLVRIRTSLNSYQLS